jgi:hypothetical protein
MAKYFIRFMPPPFGPEEASPVVPLLCDEAGTPLPNQKAVIIRMGQDDVVTATVEFVLGAEMPVIVAG